jgi:hypothetical protein
MTRPSEDTVAALLADFGGLYARVAQKLNVSAPMVSWVADGNRVSTKIETALHEELKAFQDKSNKYLRAHGNWHN